MATSQEVIASPTATDLLDLPDDILTLVLAYLEPKSFLDFCSTSRNLYQNYHNASYYWRTKAATTFRLPISPLLEADGPRWFWLYKKLKTQTRLYTWGQGVKGNLGPAIGNRGPAMPMGPALPIGPTTHMGRPRIIGRRMRHERTTSQWPTETHIPDQVGAIVDVQCGGWSTTILSSDGKLFTVGIFNADRMMNVGPIATEFTRLEYLAQSTTAIRQFSAGRQHVLALDDNQEILTWDRLNAKGYKVFSKNGRDFGGKAKKVVAGWSMSSAYVPDTGIVYWETVKNDQRDDMLDGVHVQERVVPGTARRTEGASQTKPALEIQSHIVLEGFIVYITSEFKLFACPTVAAAEDGSPESHHPFEIPGYARQDRELIDVQGSFRSFVVLTSEGKVLAGNTDYLRRCFLEYTDSRNAIQQTQPSYSSSLLASRPADVPALQSTGVIQVAFGDYHYQALHADGTITAHGVESRCCGSLGLGDIRAGSRFRGFQRSQPLNGDGNLLPISDIRGRQVWFEPEKKDWLRWMEDRYQSTLVGGTAQQQGGARPILDIESRQAAFSEWVEQEGRHWAEGPVNSDASNQPPPQWGSEKKEMEGVRDYAELSAYFAISVAAAGWHSAALVLVDEEKAAQTKAKWMVAKPHRPVPGEFEVSSEIDEEEAWVTQPFPKLRLPDGFEMAGQGDFLPWRDGMPTMRDLGLATTNPV